jgi:hypothetical protein
MRWVEHVAHMGRMGMYTGFGGRARRKATTRCRRGWEDNIKTDLRVVDWDGME